jgi:hypothetical protein
MEFKNFLRRARGSVYEYVPILAVALDNGYLSEDRFKELHRECLKLAKSISALVNSIKWFFLLTMNHKLNTEKFNLRLNFSRARRGASGAL